MLKTFLPGMIERKGGRIVAIASISAKLSLPLGITYSSTKYGVHGLMEALYDELCMDDYDEFIKLSTIFPYFVNTRKELGDILDSMEDQTPRLTPEFTADEIVKGVMANRRNIVITPVKLHTLIQ
jgi:all-trans-retinol dehydrogenase (NAD+)